MADRIIGTPFTSETAPKHGRPKGAKNRATLYRNLVEAVAIKCPNERLGAALAGLPDAAQPRTLAEHAAAALYLQALTGDVAAIRELFDSAYGKIVEKSESNLTVNSMPMIKDKHGKELKFDIGKEPRARREQTEVEE